MNKDLKYSEMTVATRKFRNFVHISGERPAVDGQEAVLVMKGNFGFYTVSQEKCTSDWTNQNREIDPTHRELHVM
jgi:hypothetical protein